LMGNSGGDHFWGPILEDSTTGTTIRGDSKAPHPQRGGRILFGPWEEDKKGFCRGKKPWPAGGGPGAGEKRQHRRNFNIWAGHQI